MKSQSSNFNGVLKILLFSLTAWPMSKCTSLHSFLSKPWVIFLFGVITLICNFIFVNWLYSQKEKKNSSFIQSSKTTNRGLLYYCCFVFSWSCMIDLIFYLNLEGYISGFMDAYLENGEEYFDTPYGVISLLFDFIYMLPLYLIIAHKIDNKKDCRNIVIFWATSMITSLGTLQYGAFGGFFAKNIHPSTFLNIPYAFLPPYLLIQFCMKKRKLTFNSERSKSWRYAFVDWSFTVIFIGLLVFNTIRNYGASNSPLPIAEYYANKLEPYLLEPAKFGASWPIFSFHFSTLVQFLLCYGLHHPGCEWMFDLSIINSALSIYGTLGHLLPQFSDRLEDKFRIPEQQQIFVIFLNLISPLASLLLLYRCFINPRYFVRQASDKSH